MKDEKGTISRRALLGGVAAGAATAAAGGAGIAFGYRYRTELRAIKLAALARPLHVPEEMYSFRRDAEVILEQHQRQTVRTVASLKAKYEDPVFGRVRVWDLVEKLAFCIDPTDMRLFCASQLVHVQQIVAAMERNGIDDPDMLLLAVVHDLGKVLLLADELPANVVCSTDRIGEFDDGIGLDSVVYQFGHGEFLYSRIKDHVPEHLAFTVRYHNVALRDARRFMTKQEHEWTDRYLGPFQCYDASFVSPYFLPKVEMARLRDLVEERFPQPILV